MASRSVDEMSQCLFSLISVNSQGLMSAPLQETIVDKAHGVSLYLAFFTLSLFSLSVIAMPDTYRAINIPEAPDFCILAS